MSVTGFWVVGVVPDQDVARLRREFPGALALGQHDAERTDALAWWSARSDQESFFEPGPNGPVPTQEALRLQDVIDTMRPEDDRHEAIKEELLHLVPQREGVDLFCASVRKGDPLAALDYALGPEAMSGLPGWCGEFLLGTAEVRAALPGVEAALALSPERRDTVAQRIRQWRCGMTDGADHDLDDLVDGPLRVLRHAAHHGLGAVGLTLCY